jgi:3-methyl-2-oxobutanoate hydroxymethyltransferase
VWHDLLGLIPGPMPRFVKQYADTATMIRGALEAYARDVRAGTFPEDRHTYGMPDQEREQLESQLNPRRSAAREKLRT